MPMNGNYMPGDANKKLYNAGSEWQDEFGGVIDYYSTFFREYDPVIGRFNSVDPKAAITVELSIYHYSGNNPVNFNDPMGDISVSEGGSLGQFLLRLYNALPSGTYHFEGGVLRGSERISRGTANTMLRELGNFVSHFSDIEDEVRQLLKDKDYKGAMDKITSLYKSDFGTPNKYYQYSFNADPNAGAWETIDGEDGGGNSIREIVVPVNELEKFVDGEVSFGVIVRSLFHEHIHVKQWYGLDGWGSQLRSDQAEREFTANYLSIMNPRLPAHTPREQHWFVTWAILKQYYQAMAPNKQEYYKNMYSQLMTLYTTGLANRILDSPKKK